MPSISNARAKAAKTAERLAAQAAAPPKPVPTPRVPKEERPARDRAKAVASFANKLETNNLESEMPVDPASAKRDYANLASRVNPISSTAPHYHFLAGVVQELDNRTYDKANPLPEDRNQDPAPLGVLTGGKRSPYNGARKLLRQAYDSLEDHYYAHANNKPLDALHHLVKAADHIQNAHEEIRRVDKAQGGYSLTKDSPRFDPTIEPTTGKQVDRWGNETGLAYLPITKNKDGLSIHDRLTTAVKSYQNIAEKSTDNPNVLSSIRQITRNYQPGQTVNAPNRYDFTNKSDEEQVSDLKARNKGSVSRRLADIESKTGNPAFGMDIAEDDATSATATAAEPSDTQVKSEKVPSLKMKDIAPIDFEESDEERQARYTSEDAIKVDKTRSQGLGVHFVGGQNAGK